MLAEQQRALDYLARKGTEAPVEVLRRQLRDAFSKVERTLDDIAPEARERAPAPGKWSAHEILDHLVMSHEPAIPQLDSLLAGVAPCTATVPADLHRDQRPEWRVLRSRLGEIHQEILSRVEGADDEVSLEPKVTVEMVIKIDGKPEHWISSLDWKALLQTIRVHTLEHNNQLQRT